MKAKRWSVRRSGGDRRNFSYATVAPEKRFGRDRRLFDRRDLKFER
ncbi:MAG: hypothetical protein PF690_14790 [Deltaproteobacteria bacterium]|jgi:hypothetical protein|nr:hypothetical protein [Deltaproteobacteria bacterium]